MRVRATLILRNDVLLAKRKTLKMTQKDAAELCGIAVQTYQAVERMDFTKVIGRACPPNRIQGHAQAW